MCADAAPQYCCILDALSPSEVAHLNEFCDRTQETDPKAWGIKRNREGCESLGACGRSLSSSVAPAFSPTLVLTGCHAPQTTSTRA